MCVVGMLLGRLQYRASRQLERDRVVEANMVEWCLLHRHHATRIAAYSRSMGISPRGTKNLVERCMSILQCFMGGKDEGTYMGFSRRLEPQFWGQLFCQRSLNSRKTDWDGERTDPRSFGQPMMKNA